MSGEKDFFRKEFEKKLSSSLDEEILSKLKSGQSFSVKGDVLQSSDYEEFKRENQSKGLGLYEKFCYYCEIFLKISPDKKTKVRYSKITKESHLNITPTGVQSSAVASALFFGILGGGIFVLNMILGFGVIVLSLLSYFFFLNLPEIIRSKLRSKASDQIIIAIFYIVSFMRFRPNFELAINFAASYIGYPLNLDFKKVLWNLENQKFPNIKTALEDYLVKWRDTNLEFLESIYLIESSLYETDEARRLTVLDKSLDVMLDAKYDKMLRFSQTLKSKVNTFNMLGVVLPVLGLIILPLAASFGDPRNVWLVTLVLYVMILPIVIGYQGVNLTNDKPGGANSIRELKNVDKKLVSVPIRIGKQKQIFVSPKFYGICVFVIFAVIGLFPLISYFFFDDLFYMVNNLKLPFSALSNYEIFYFQKITDAQYTFGPYGFYGVFFSLFFVLSLGLGVGYYFFYKYRNLIHLRDRTKKLEEQFPTATFQLGHRINEGISPELAFGVVAEMMKGTEAGRFFENVDKNIKFGGMTMHKAILDPEKGALRFYSSDLIESSMQIIISAFEEGPHITASTLIDLSKYLTSLHSAQERLIDLLAEPLGSMKSQKDFLAPVISSIVISIVFLVTTIMNQLKSKVSEVEATAAASGASTGGMDPGFMGASMPTYLFQIPVGLYIISVIVILVIVLSNLENGDDKVYMKYQIGLSLIKALKKYVIITICGCVMFAFVASKIGVATP